MPYCITLRSRTDTRITGWYDGSDSRWSTDHNRQKVFDKKRDARPVCDELRSLCPRKCRSCYKHRSRAGRPCFRRDAANVLALGRVLVRKEAVGRASRGDPGPAAWHVTSSLSGPLGARRYCKLQCRHAKAQAPLSCRF